MFVKPKSGLSIRDPDLYDLLPEEGREVPESGYWLRRLRDGDVVPATASAVAEPAQEV